MKARTLIAALTFLSAVSQLPQGHAGSVPIVVSGFNQDMVVEAGATDDPTTHYQSSVTATMDQGTALRDNTWYEAGLAGSGGGGLPTGGLVTSLLDSSTQFQLGPYAGLNALMLDASTTTGTLALLSPGRFSSLSLLTSSGASFFGTPSLSLTVHFADGTPSLSGLSVDAPDWFAAGPTALVASGRVGVDTGIFDQVGTDFPRMFQQTVVLPAEAWDHAVSSIDITWSSNGSDNAHTGIFALSGVAVPEPASLALLGTGLFAVAIATRRLSGRPARGAGSRLP